ncbi:MAG: hypothetical protein QNL04_11120, partial [SAR324 cluster bacterium]|nr:hypothetical protein [SAR324 cluster bacterium]
MKAKDLFYAVRIRRTSFPLEVIKNKLIELLQQILAASDRFGYPVIEKINNSDGGMSSNKDKFRLKKEEEKELRLEVLGIVLSRLSVEELGLYLKKSGKKKKAAELFWIDGEINYKYEFQKYATFREKDKRTITNRLKKITDDFAGMIVSSYLDTLSQEEQGKWLIKHELEKEDIGAANLKANSRELILDLLSDYADGVKLFSEIVSLGPKWVAGKFGKQQISYSPTVTFSELPQREKSL